MATKILSYFDGEHWRILKVPQGYFHRPVSGSPTWNSGIPQSLSTDQAEEMFHRLPEDESLLRAKDLQYKRTFSIGATKTQCFQFTTAEGDPFTVQIPAVTLRALQTEFPGKRRLPELRLAHLALEYALEHGPPEIEIEIDGPIWSMIKHRLGANPW